MQYETKKVARQAGSDEGNPAPSEFDNDCSVSEPASDDQTTPSECGGIVDDFDPSGDLVVKTPWGSMRVPHKLNWKQLACCGLLVSGLYLAYLIAQLLTGN